MLLCGDGAGSLPPAPAVTLAPALLDWSCLTGRKLSWRSGLFLLCSQGCFTEVQ